MAAMERGVKGCKYFVSIITDDGAASYFSREMCREEVKWAEKYGKPIIAVVTREDEPKVGQLIAEGKSFGLDFSQLNFCAFDRTGPRQIQASLADILERGESWRPVKVVMDELGDKEVKDHPEVTGLAELLQSCELAEHLEAASAWCEEEGVKSLKMLRKVELETV
jgi:hypothetical protein